MLRTSLPKACSDSPGVCEKRKNLHMLRRVSCLVLFIAKPKNKPVALPKGECNFVLNWMLQSECRAVFWVGAVWMLPDIRRFAR